MKILISENKVDIIRALIKREGVKHATNIIGGFENLVKILGHDSVPEYIYQYLTENTYPDYNWNSHEDYKQELEIYGSIEFFLNDVEGYLFDDRGRLDIKPWLWDELEELFDDYDWKSVFKKWFEDNSGLKVNFLE
jgi:hypothetical protein